MYSWDWGGLPERVLSFRSFASTTRGRNVACTGRVNGPTQPHLRRALCAPSCKTHFSESGTFNMWGHGATDSQLPNAPGSQATGHSSLIQHVDVRGGGGAQLVRCGTATFAPAAPAPRPSLRNQFSSSGLWPVACCIVPVFQSLPPWLGSGLWVLGFIAWGHFAA